MGAGAGATQGVPRISEVNCRLVRACTNKDALGAPVAPALAVSWSKDFGPRHDSLAFMIVAGALFY